MPKVGNLDANDRQFSARTILTTYWPLFLLLCIGWEILGQVGVERGGPMCNFESMAR